MRGLLALLFIALACLGTGSLASAADPPAAASDEYLAASCDALDANTLAVVDCAGIDGVPSLDPADTPTVASLAAAAAAEAAAEPSPAWLPAYCRQHVDAAFYTSSDWVRLGQKLLAEASPCADYYISIPVLAADKTGCRPLQDDLIRALGPRFHPVAELHFAGWNAWWKANGKTPAEAGRAFVKKALDCGYQFDKGETWALNEMHSGIRNNVPGARDNMIQLLDAVREASGVQGIVWVIGVGQQTINVTDYKAKLQEWLQDAPFWTAMARDVWYWAQETYPDMRYWGVAAASRAARTDNLSLFIEHPLLLAENGPQGVATAVDFFERTFASLASAAWPWTSGFGNTAFSDDQMKRFIAEQTFAVKHLSLSRPHDAPGARVAFAYAPGNNVCPNPDKWGTVIPCDAKTFSALTGGILDRLASSIHYAYEQGGGTQTGACGPPDDRTWCSAEIPDAAFNPVWVDFPDWLVAG
jgi:hypothetical protein